MRPLSGKGGIRVALAETGTRRDGSQQHQFLDAAKAAGGLI